MRLSRMLSGKRVALMQDLISLTSSDNLMAPTSGLTTLNALVSLIGRANHICLMMGGASLIGLLPQPLTSSTLRYLLLTPI